MRGPIIITGGGTGGHVFPMQAIAEGLLASGVQRSEIRFVGSRRGQEATILAQSGIELTLLPGRGIRRSFSPSALRANVGAVLGLLSGVFQALVIIAKWRPRAVVSVGGYASFAVSLGAVVWRRPLILVELDAEPGAAQRIVGRFAQKRCRAFTASDVDSVVTGAPVRQSILDVDRSPEGRERARRAATPPIDLARWVVVVMTGSLGSTRVNEAVSALATRWTRRDDVTIIHVTGRRDYRSAEQARPETSGLDYRIVEFGDMVELWALADVALCRAGALTIAELTVLGLPSVLVPLPGAPGDHQTKNARELERVGAARIINDAACDGAALELVLDEIIDATTLSRMSNAALELGRRDATAAIVNTICEVASCR